MAAPGFHWTMLVTLLITKIGNGLPTTDFDKDYYDISSSTSSDISSGDYSLDSFDLRDLSNLNNRFALDLYQAIAKDSDKENIFFSPFSVSNSLGMTYLGARGNTSQQMREVMGFDSIDNLEFHRSFRDLNELISSSLTQTCTLRSANRVFVMDGVPLSDTFVADTRSYYNMTAENLDFASERRNAQKTINTWVRDKTAGKIRNLIGRSDLTPLTVLVLVNAVYFKGDWDQPFKRKYTRPAMFHLGDKTSVEVPMMYQSGRFPFGFDSVSNCDVIELPYHGRQVSMVIALPRQTPETINGLDSLERQLSPETFQRWSKITQTVYKLDVHLPKFSLKEEIELDSILKSLGMTDLFDIHHADLSGVCQNSSKVLYVSKAKHQAGIVINEEGSEAAAASAIIMSGRSKGGEVNINRPFLFYIRHNPTQTALFIGRVKRPQTKTKYIESNDVLAPSGSTLAAARRSPDAVADGRRSRSRVGRFYQHDAKRY